MSGLTFYAITVLIGIIIMFLLCACAIHEPKPKIKPIDWENIKERVD